MHSFEVVFRSFEDVRDFVVLASAQAFVVFVTGGNHRVDGKSMMVMLSLYYSQPLQVSASCDREEFLHFMEAAARFRVY